MRLRSLLPFLGFPADTSALGRLSAIQLDTILQLADADPAWTEDGRQLSLLQLPDNAWGVNPGDRRALHALMRALRPTDVLEIGTHIGCSTLSMALALRRGNGRLWTVDLQDVNDPVSRPWEGHGSRASPRQLAEEVGLADGITFVTADSLQYLRSCRQRFDFIFLDGLHTAEQVYHEVILSLPRLLPGGFILLHDYFPDREPLWPDGVVIDGPYLAIERLRRAGVDLAVLPLGPLPWPTKQRTHITSLALLTKE